jgi:hypothetical protein
MSYISVRRGATLLLTCTKKNSSGTPENITGVTITATLTEVTSGDIVETFSVTKTGATGVFTLILSDSETAKLPASTFNANIKYDYTTSVNIAEPFKVTIVK